MTLLFALEIKFVWKIESNAWGIVVLHRLNKFPVKPELVLSSPCTIHPVSWMLVQKTFQRAS